ncbi:DUF4912 domain-containing protein [Paenibacillus sp. MBLB4367]|uniref:DUF4912 domain-containing protein n=1 Tax=Paenibacillus sp. MBLB4367 TaxID=3384767 RepID=UPI0039082F9D
MEDGRIRRTEQPAPEERETEEQPYALGAKPPIMREEKEQRTFGDDDFSFENYENDRLELLPRDWSTLYAYWDITDDRKRMVERYSNCKWEQLQKVLRIYDVNEVSFSGDNANDWWDVELAGGSNHGFVGGMRADCAYCMDYGIRTKEGKFVAILRSNSVTLPRNAEVGSGGAPGRKRRAEGSETQTDAESEEADAEAGGEQPIPAWMSRFTGYSLQES